MTIPDRLLPTLATWTVASSSSDRYGDTVRSWYYATSSTITCRIEQTGTSESNNETRDALSATYRLFTNEARIGGRDRITVGATVYEVIGQPAIVADGVGTHHVEAQLRTVDG